MSSKNTHNQSLTEQAASRLRQDIIYAFFPPDTKLNIESLKKRYEMGGTPVREALNQMTVLGLVNALPLRGFQVATISASDARDVFNNRVFIEKIMLKEAVKHGDDMWESQLITSVHRVKKCMQQQSFLHKPDIKRWLKLCNDFNSALFKAVSSKWLCRMQGELFLHAQRYEYLFYQHNSDFISIAKATLRVMKNILEACLEKSYDVVVDLHRSHLRNLLEMIHAYLKDEEQG